MKILDIPKTSVSDVKKSPMDVFKQASEENSGVYVFNRDKVAGVMLTQEQYETLNKKLDSLYDEIVHLTAEKRLMDKNVSTYSDEEVRGTVANGPMTIDENDGWE